MKRLLLSAARASMSLAILSTFLCACGGPIECKTEITDGSASFKGAATAKVEDPALRTASIRDACAQRCGAQKAPMLDACVAACVTDVGAQKLGAKTTCGNR